VTPMFSLIAWISCDGSSFEVMDTLQQLTVPNTVRQRSGAITKAQTSTPNQNSLVSVSVLMRIKQMMTPIGRLKARRIVIQSKQFLAKELMDVEDKNLSIVRAATMLANIPKQPLDEGDAIEIICFRGNDSGRQLSLRKGGRRINVLILM